MQDKTPLFNEYSVVQLKKDFSDRLKAKYRGVVLLVYVGKGYFAYEVEFLDPEGNTIDVITIQENWLEEYLQTS